jgi:hypothetical protein
VDARRVIANALMVLGAWYAASYLAYWLTIALIPINNRLIYDGDTGVVIMHVWSAFPLAVMAGLAVVALLWVSDVARKGILLVVITCLFLYSGFGRSRRVWGTAGETIDRAGAVVEGVTPAAVCLLVGVYSLRRMSSGRS